MIAYASDPHSSHLPREYCTMIPWFIMWKTGGQNSILYRGPWQAWVVVKIIKDKCFCLSDRVLLLIWPPHPPTRGRLSAKDCNKYSKNLNRYLLPSSEIQCFFSALEVFLTHTDMNIWLPDKHDTMATFCPANHLFKEDVQLRTSYSILNSLTHAEGCMCPCSLPLEISKSILTRSDKLSNQASRVR